MNRIIFLILTFFPLLNYPFPALATLGVGVGTGKIELSGNLKAGSIYTLPSIGVFNTGDEEAEYEVTVTFNETQDQLKPDKKWFRFTPAKFTLKPKETKNVAVTMTLPLTVKPEAYMAYLEAHPIGSKQVNGGTSVGVAAAARLYFRVGAGNLLLAVYFRISSLISRIPTSAWLIIALAIFTVLYFILRKHLKIEIKVKSNK